MTSIDTLTIPFFAIILVGYLCGRLVRLPEDGLAWMSVFVLYIAVPAMFFAVVSRTPIEQFVNWPFAVATTSVTLCTLALSFGYAYFCKGRDVARATIAATIGGYSNGGYIGVPLMLTAFGAEAAVPTTLIFIADSAAIFALVPLMMASAGSERGSVAATLWLICKRVVLHPFNLATALAILSAALGLRLPGAADQTLDLLKNSAAPCALFLLGVTVALRPLTGVPVAIFMLLAIKLVLHPLLMLLVISALGYPPVWIETAVLMAALPPALGVFILAKQFDVWVKEASNAVLLGTFASLLTITLLLHALRMGAVPGVSP
jgi:malonate transporter and related proteins